MQIFVLNIQLTKQHYNDSTCTTHIWRRRSSNKTTFNIYNALGMHWELQCKAFSQFMNCIWTNITNTIKHHYTKVDVRRQLYIYQKLLFWTLIHLNRSPNIFNFFWWFNKDIFFQIDSILKNALPLISLLFHHISHAFSFWILNGILEIIRCGLSYNPYTFGK